MLFIGIRGMERTDTFPNFTFNFVELFFRAFRIGAFFLATFLVGFVTSGVVSLCVVLKVILHVKS